MDFDPEWANEKGSASFRRIPPLLKRDIEQFARERNFPIGLAARFLLSYSLLEYKNGNLKFYPQMSQLGWTLYPEDVLGKKIKVTYRTVTFRKIPDWLDKEIESISRNIPLGSLSVAVKKGDVARTFFEYAVNNYRRK
ncbi:MAG: hypothetical protein ACYDH2_03425 [Anaerolineaceae bacterium]